MSAELEERGEDTAGTDASPMPNSRTNGQRASSNGVDAHAVREGRTIEAKGPENLHDCTPDPPERPAKKMKRGKYISRACTSCKRRKIKCEGGDPCAQCIARNRPCVSAPRGRQHSMDDRTISGRSEAGTNASHAPGDILAHHDVVVRLVEVERKLSMMQASAHDSMTFRDHSHLPRARSVEKYHTPASTELESILEADGQTFAGELSINLAFNGIDEGVDMATKFSPSTLPEFLAGSSLQHPESLSGEDGSRKVRGWLEGILDNYGVVADESEWRRSLNIFLEEVHILYPILHPPTLWDIFDGMWENSVLWNMTNPAEREHKRLSVALVCFCLALGRCSVPTRMTDASGVRSAGWSLYSVGVSLMQDAMGLSNTAAKSLLTLQLLLLRVLYLFRLDATQRASRLLALAVSNAHIIGLHRQRTLDSMPAFANQMYCRTWWSLYLLDRRIALESGQPYLIQDNNVDTALPLDLSDEWLSRFTTTTETIADLQPEITAEVSNSPMTSIPYLLVRIRFSRIVGRAWEVLYGVKPSNTTSDAMIEYTDTMLCKLLDKMPSDLSYDPRLPPGAQFSARPRWRVKQTMVLFTCCTFLRLLIRSLSLSGLKPAERMEDDELESITVCATLAASILTAHDDLPDDNLKHSFPFSHYLFSATMVMTALVSRERTLKRRYRDAILEATRSLNLYCHRIWVSGKMIQWVSRLTLLVQRTLLDDPSDGQHLQDVGSLRWNCEPRHPRGDTQQLPSQPDTSNMPRTHRRTETSTASNKGQSGMSAEDEESAAISGMRSEGDHNDGSSMALWSADTGVETRADMSDWRMPDLNFQPAINKGAGLCLDKNAPELSITADDANLASRRVDVFDMDRGMHNTIYDALGLNGVFDLDVDIDQAMANLCSPINMGF